MFTASLPQARRWDTLDIYSTPLSNHYHTQSWAPTAITDEETTIQREHAASIHYSRSGVRADWEAFSKS